MPDQADARIDRRPIQARATWWAKSLASSCARAGITPNQVSLGSVAFAAAGALALVASSRMFISTTIPVADPASVAAASATASAIISSPLHAVLFVLAALCVQLRLLCNMIDGMIAVEGNMQSKLGAVYNEFPDRVADTLFLVAAGYAAQAGHVGVELGWAAALLAASTAYVRAFATAQGLPQDFSGPMAKQHRMFVLTVASLAAAMESVFGWTPHAMTVGLVLIAFGSLITCIKRTVRMANGLESRP